MHHQIEGQRPLDPGWIHLTAKLTNKLSNKNANNNLLGSSYMCEMNMDELCKLQLLERD